jgi:hypothetical protein
MKPKNTPKKLPKMKPTNGWAVVRALRSAIKSRDEYIKLLGEELNGLATFGSVHGWRSGLVQEGIAARDKIKRDDELVTITQRKER